MGTFITNSNYGFINAEKQKKDKKIDREQTHSPKGSFLGSKLRNPKSKPTQRSRLPIYSYYKLEASVLRLSLDSDSLGKLA